MTGTGGSGALEAAAGPAAARTAAAAAFLTAAVARASAASWPEAQGAAAQAVDLAERLEALAVDDERLWRRAEDALVGGGLGDAELERRLRAAALAVLRISEAAGDVAELAAAVAERAGGGARGDAAAAAALAYGATRAAAHLVEVNLALPAGAPERAAAAAACGAAEAASRRALDHGR